MTEENRRGHAKVNNIYTSMERVSHCWCDHSVAMLFCCVLCCSVLFCSDAGRYVDKAYYLSVHKTSAAMATFKQTMATAPFDIKLAGQSYNELNVGFML